MTKKLPAHITKTASGKFRVRYQKSTKFPIDYDESFDTLEEAIKANEKYLAKNTLGMHDEVKHIGFSDACDEYLEWLRNKTKKPAPQTITSYKKYIGILKIAIGNVDIVNINSIFLTKILAKEKERPKRGNGKRQGGTISSNTLHHEYSMLSILFNRFCRWNWLKINPMDDVEEPDFTVKEVVVPEFEELDDIKNKIMKAKIRDRLQYLYALFGGLRAEEVAGQHLDRDIDRERMLVRVITVIVRDENGNWIEDKPKSESSVRKIPMPEEFFDVLDEYLVYRENFIKYLKIKNPNYKEIPNLFLIQYGGFYRPPRISRTWGEFRIREGINLDITFHGIRHYYLTNQMNYNPKLTERDVQDLAGHADLRTTRGYVHASKKKIEKYATSIFNSFSKESLFKNGYDVLTIPVEHVASIIIGKAELSKLEDLKVTLEVISNEKVDFFNLSSIIDKSKNYLITNMPSLGNIEKYKYGELSNEEILEKVKRQFGKEIQIEI